MSNVKTVAKISRDELLALRKQGMQAKELRLSTANSKGRKLGFLGAEYAQRQNSQFLRQFTSEDIAVALYEKGMISIWKDDMKGNVFGFTDEEGNVPDDAEFPHVTVVEQVVREWAENQDEPAAEEKPARKPRAAK